MDDIKQKVVELLDADKDGQLTLDDAKKLALEMADPETLRQLAEQTRSNVRLIGERLAPYKTSIAMSAGFIGCFYGSNFKYSILFAKTFAVSGWPTLKPAVEELKESYERGKLAFNPEAPLFVLTAIDPKKLLNVLKGAYVGLSASFAGVLSASAAKLGLGVGLGDSIGGAVNSVVAPLITRYLRQLKDISTIDNAVLAQWVDTIIAALSTALGVYIAHRVDDVIYLYSACVAGATLFVDSADKLVKIHPQVKHLLIAGLSAAGFVNQRIFNGGQIPFLLKLPLAPLAIAESFLNSLAISIRASSLNAH